MRVGTDSEGREISFEETNNTWSIGGLSSSLEKVIAYDRGGQVTWESTEVQKWAYDAEQARQGHVAEQGQARQAVQEDQQREDARRRSLTVEGYDPRISVKLAGALNGVANVIVAVFIAMGVVDGLVLGAVAARQFPLGLVLFPLVFGFAGWLIGWLSVLLVRVVAQGLMTVAQIEANTRRV